MRAGDGRLGRASCQIFLVLGCLLLCTFAASAQDAYSSTLWRTSAGLPENFVQAILAADDQQLWIATTGGLSRFDGSSFTTLSEKQLAGVPVNSFSCLSRTRDGSLWAGTEGGGLVHITVNRSELFDSRSGLSDQYVRSIYEDSEGRLWIGTDGGLFLKNGNLFRFIHFGAKGSKQDVFRITEDKQHHLLVGGTQLWRLGPAGGQALRLSGTDSQNLVKGMLVAQDGVLWVGTATGLFRYTGKSFQRIKDARVSDMIQGRDGTIWVGTNNIGLLAFRNGKLTSVGLQNHPLKAVISLFEDTDGRLWVGTKSGLLRLQQTSVQVIPRPVAGTEFGTVSSNPHGGVSLAIDHVFEVSSGRSQVVHFPGLERTFIIEVLYGRDGTTWLGTLTNGVYHITPAKVEHYSTRSAQPIAGDAPRGLLETQEGDVWVATGFGLDRIRNGLVTRYDTANGLPSRNIRSLLEDRAHCLWIGTEAGLAHLCGGKLVEDAATDALRGEKIWVMLQDRNGSLWFGTRDHGLYRSSGGQILHLTTADGLSSNTIYGLQQDALGRFWMSSPETISSISERDMERASGDRNDFLAVITYSMPQGSEGTQFAGGRFPSGCIARDNSVWFVSDQGAIHVAQQVDPSVHPPLPFIMNVSMASEPLRQTGWARTKSSSRHNSFEYASHFLGPTNEIKTMYRLEGLDSNWSSGGPAGSVEYGRLAPGKYRFEVKTFLRKQPSRYTVATFGLISEPSWYKTRWALILFFLVSSLLLAAAYMLRLQRLRSRFKLVLEERGRLAREMHDTVIQGCNGVSSLLEAVAGNRNSPANGKLLTLARSQIQATIAEAREAVWGLRKATPEKDDFYASLRHLADQSEKALGISVLIEHRGRPVIFGFGTVHELVMIAREAIANAGAHAKPSCIHLRTSSLTTSFEMKIEDDGRGFQVGDGAGLQDGHYGLIGMRERAERIRANLSIVSAPDMGTCVHVEMPRP